MKPQIFQSIVEAANDGILVCGDQGRIEFANRMASEMTGYTIPDLLHRPVTSLFGKTHQSLFEELFTRRRPFSGPGAEVQLLPRRGSPIDVEVYAAASEENTYIYLHDIRDRKQA